MRRLKRPVVWLALIWVMGAYIVLVDEQRWLYLLLSLVLVVWLIWPSLFNVSRQMCLLFITIFILSVGYNMWFDGRSVSSLTQNYDSISSGKEITLIGKIVTPVDVDGDRISFVMKDIYHEKIQIFIRLKAPLEQLEAERWKRGNSIELTGALQQPEDARNFDMFEYKTYLYLQHIHWILQVKGLQEVEVNPPSSWSILHIYRWTDAIRQTLGNKVDRIFSEDYSGFMKSLLIGLRDDVQPEQFQQFSFIGLTHIMAISGLHVAVFIAGCMGLMKYAGLTRETNQLITMMLIPVYIILTGAAPSVVRAGCMAVIALYALRKHRLKDGLHIISIVGTAMLVYNPYYLFQISFQLSFIVTLGLIIAVPIFNKMIPVSSPWISSAISVTLAAQLFSFPLSIYYFNQFSLLSWLANLFLVPVVSLFIIPMGMITLVVSLLNEQIASWLAALIDYVNIGLFFSVERLNGFKVFLMIWPTPSPMWMLLYYFLLTVILWCFVQRGSDRMKKVFILPLYLCIGGFTLLLVFGYNPHHLDRSGLVQFIDVGQGDSIFIRTPNNRIILIDGGGTLNFSKQGDEWRSRKDPYEVGKNLLVPLLKKRGVHHIDHLIITHAHMDHYGGLQEVLEQIPVKEIIFNGTTSGTASFTKLFQTALNLKIPIYIANEGKQVQVDKHTKLSFLFPIRTQEIREMSSQNAISVVSLLEMYDYRFLFTGDMELNAERELIGRLENKGEADNNNNVYPIDVLKVAHHGSRTSTTEEWLKYWRPKISVIPVGRYNSYGHPHPDVVQRLENHNSTVYRSDFNGEVQIEVIPNLLRIRSKLSP